VSLAEPAGLLTQVMNETPFDFRRSRDGHIEAWTRDGDFDYFESSHEYSPMPLVVLRFEGRKWVNVSGQYRDEYDHRIAKARREPAAAHLFRRAAAALIFPSPPAGDYNQKIVSDRRGLRAYLATAAVLSLRRRPRVPAETPVPPVLREKPWKGNG